MNDCELWDILVVEDSAEIARTWQRQLEAMNCRVDIAYSLAEAKSLIQRVPPHHLVILDLCLPDSTDKAKTLRFCEEIKKLTPPPKVIIATGCADADLRALAKEMGADSLKEKLELRSQSLLWAALKDHLDGCRDSQESVMKGISLQERLSEIIPVGHQIGTQ